MLPNAILPKEASQDATKASKVPSNHVVSSRSGVRGRGKLSQSPVSREAPDCMSAEIAKLVLQIRHVSLRLDARLAKQPRPFSDLGAHEGFGPGGPNAQAPAATGLQPRTHFGRALRAGRPRRAGARATPPAVRAGANRPNQVSISRSTTPVSMSVGTFAWSGRAHDSTPRAPHCPEST